MAHAIVRNDEPVIRPGPVATPRAETGLPAQPPPLPTSRYLQKKGGRLLLPRALQVQL